MRPYVKYLIIATILLFCGAAFPFLMIIRVVPTTFWLSILSYIASVVGLILGMYGVTSMVIAKRNEREWDDWRNPK